MDKMIAPQWADFNTSLRPDVDDYFNTHHSYLELNHGEPISFVDSPDSKASVPSSTYNTPSSNRISSTSEIINSVPQHSLGAACSTPYLSKTNDSLVDGLKNLRIRSEKKTKARDLSKSLGISRVKKSIAKLQSSSYYCATDEEILEKVNNEILQEAEVIKEPQRLDIVEIPEKANYEILVETEAAVEVLPLELSNTDVNVSGRDCTLIENYDDKQSGDLDKSIAKSEEPEIILEKLDIKTAVEVSDKIPQECAKLERNIIVKKEEFNSRKLQARLDPSKRVVRKKTEATTNSTKGPTYSIRRYSFSKYRRQSNKYVPLAEAVSKFQNGTPKRFRSMRHNDPNPSALQKGKQHALKLTCAQSPALRCKLRTRAVTIPNHEERELMQIEEIRKKRIKPNPIKKSATNPGEALNKVKSKIDDAAFAKPSKPVTKTNDKLTTMPNSLTVSQNMKQNMNCLSTTVRSKVTRKTIGSTPCKTTVLAVVPTDSDIMMTDFEISNFGIPVGSTEYKKVTRTIPFSFDRRNKEQDKKDKNKDVVQKDDEMKPKTLFHARPAPRLASINAKTATSKTTTTTTTTTTETVLRKTKESKANKPHTVPCPFSFEKRDQLLQKKKKDLANQLVEQEKKARIFHAKPAPEFKPVFVRGISSENLNGGENAVDKRIIRGVSPKRRTETTNQKSHQAGNQENKPPNAALNQQCPKLKNPMLLHATKLKKAAK